MQHFYSNIKSLLVIIFILLFFMLQAQEDVIKNAIENLTEQSETEFDYSDLLDEFLELQKNPVNINSVESEKLVSLFLMDHLQYHNLRQYIDSNGYLLSPQELLIINGIGFQTYQNILPFIKFELPAENPVGQFPRMMKYGKHQAFLRYQRVLQLSDGYLNRSDSVLNLKPNSKYLGNTDKYYFKYQYKYADLLSLGMVAEKDAGEIFFENIDNPTIDSLVGDRIQKGFDFYSAHLFIQKMGWLKQAVIGDYHLLFGQGLNMWSALAFGKSGSATNIKKFERGIKANTSTDENKFLRGAAVQLAYKSWELTAFYSSKKQDATDFQQAEDQENNFIQSLNGTGYHRTVSELLKKNALKTSLYGSRLRYTFNRIAIGLTASRTILDKSIIPSNQVYQYFQLKGKENTVIGADYQFQWKKFSFFGEFSQNLNNGWALISGLNAPLSNRLSWAVLYRNYQKNYTNLFGAAFGENSQNNNEEGIYSGISFQVNSKLLLKAYADIFRFPWLKFRTDAPSVGTEYSAIMDYDFSRSIQMQFRLRYKSKEINFQEEFKPTEHLQQQDKYSFRFHISFQLNPQLILKNRIEYQVFKTEYSDQETGFLIYQDVNFKSKNKKLGIHTRFALFDVTAYDARIYAYENDLLYVFSIPAYYNRGIRAYFLFNYKINSTFQFWLKLAHSWFENQDQIGSGLNTINDNKKNRSSITIKNQNLKATPSP